MGWKGRNSMNWIWIALGTIALLNAFMMWCMCVVASRADRQDEALFREWQEQHGQEADA